MVSFIKWSTNKTCSIYGIISIACMSIAPADDASVASRWRLSGPSRWPRPRRRSPEPR